MRKRCRSVVSTPCPGPAIVSSVRSCRIVERSDRRLPARSQRLTRGAGPPHRFVGRLSSRRTAAGNHPCREREASAASSPRSCRRRSPLGPRDRALFTIVVCSAAGVRAPATCDVVGAPEKGKAKKSAQAEPVDIGADGGSARRGSVPGHRPGHGRVVHEQPQRTAGQGGRRRRAPSSGCPARTSRNHGKT